MKSMGSRPQPAFHAFTDGDILECFPKQQEAEMGLLQLQIGKKTLTQFLRKLQNIKQFEGTFERKP